MRRLLGAVVLVAALAACGSGSALPDVTGTWVGDYQYALPDGSRVDASERIVIERQEAELVWGYESWTGEDGEPQRTGLTGALVNGGAAIILTEPGGFFQGRVDGATMTLTFVRTTKAQHTAFEVTLTRE